MDGVTEKGIFLAKKAIELMREFERWLVTDIDTSDRSKKDYVISLEKSIIPYFIEKSLNLSVDGWDRFCELQFTENKLSPATLNNYHSHHKRFFTFLEEEKFINQNNVYRIKRFESPKRCPDIKTNDIKKFTD